MSKSRNIALTNRETDRDSYLIDIFYFHLSTRILVRMTHIHPLHQVQQQLRVDLGPLFHVKELQLNHQH